MYPVGCVVLVTATVVVPGAGPTTLPVVRLLWFFIQIITTTIKIAAAAIIPKTKPAMAPPEKI